GVGVLHLASGNLVASFPGHKHHVIGLAFSADGRRLTSASCESVRRWDVRTGNSRSAPPLGTLAYSATLTLSNDGGRVAAAPKETGRSVHVLQLREESIDVAGADAPHVVSNLAFSPDDRLLAV